MGQALERFFAGLNVIGLDRKHAMRLVEEVALSSVPPIRRRAFECLSKEPTETGEIAQKLRLPKTTVRRTLEELAAHNLVVRQLGETGRTDWWSVDPEWCDVI